MLDTLFTSAKVRPTLFRTVLLFCVIFFLKAFRIRTYVSGCFPGGSRRWLMRVCRFRRTLSVFQAERVYCWVGATSFHSTAATSKCGLRYTSRLCAVIIVLSLTRAIQTATRCWQSRTENIFLDSFQDSKLK